MQGDGNYQEIEGSVTVIEVNNSLDSRNAAAFENDIEYLLSKGKNLIVLNCKSLRFVSSEGIGSLMYAARMVAANDGIMILCSLPCEVSVLLNTLNVNKILNIVETKQQSINFIYNEFFNHKRSDKETKFIPLPSANIEKEQEVILSDYSNNYSDAPEMRQVPKVPEINNPVQVVFFSNPLVVECSHCGSFLRVKQSGAYMCPTCKNEFSVENDGTVVF